MSRVVEAWKHLFNAPNKMPRNVGNALRAYGELQVTAVTVVSLPLIKIISTVVTRLPGTNLEEPLRHLCMVLHLGRVMMFVEKNQYVEMKIVFKENVDDLLARTGAWNETVRLPKRCTLVQFFSNTERMLTAEGKNMWNYNPRDANCQDFVADCLTANGAMTESLRAAIVQASVKQGISEGTLGFMKGITNTASMLGQLFGMGDGTLGGAMPT